MFRAQSRRGAEGSLRASPDLAAGLGEERSEGFGEVFQVLAERFAERGGKVLLGGRTQKLEELPWAVVFGKVEYGKVARGIGGFGFGRTE